MENLDELRDRINKIDNQMVELFEERMDVVSKVAEYKKKNHIKVLDEDREKEVIKIQLKNIRHQSMKNEVEAFLRDIMDISKSVQGIRIMELNDNDSMSVAIDKSSCCKVGFQGIPASFSHEALIDFFGHKVEAVGFDYFENVFQALEKGHIDYGVLPIENSSTGGIPQVYDLLEKYNFYIVGEKCIKVNHNLMGLKGASVEDIEEVYSHTQAFMQSSRFLENHRQWKLIPYFNTAKSAEYVRKENNKNKASIASRKAAEFYGLQLLQENINDNSNNYTRFIIIGRNMIYDKKFNKISILITLSHEAGSLYNVLKFFWKNNLNMTKIESRPVANRPWQYFFCIDFYGNVAEMKTKDSLEGIKKESSYFKLLGNYKEG